MFKRLVNPVRFCSDEWNKEKIYILNNVERVRLRMCMYVCVFFLLHLCFLNKIYGFTFVAVEHLLSRFLI